MLGSKLQRYIWGASANVSKVGIRHVRVMAAKCILAWLCSWDMNTKRPLYSDVRHSAMLPSSSLHRHAYFTLNWLATCCSKWGANGGSKETGNQNSA
jgi:hypothetical protein